MTTYSYQEYRKIFSGCRTYEEFETLTAEISKLVTEGFIIKTVEMRLAALENFKKFIP